MQSQQCYLLRKWVFDALSEFADEKVKPKLDIGVRILQRHSIVRLVHRIQVAASQVLRKDTRQSLAVQLLFRLDELPEAIPVHFCCQKKHVALAELKGKGIHF